MLKKILIITTGIILFCTEANAGTVKDVREYLLEQNGSSKITRDVPVIIEKDGKDCILLFKKDNSTGEKLRCKDKPAKKEGAKNKSAAPLAVHCGQPGQPPICGDVVSGNINYVWCKFQDASPKFKIDIYYGPSGLFYMGTLNGYCSGEPSGCSSYCP